MRWPTERGALESEVRRRTRRSFAPTSPNQIDALLRNELINAKPIDGAE